MANSVFVAQIGVISGNNLTIGQPSLLVSHKLQVTDTTGEITTGNDGFFYWNTRAVFTSPADSQINFTNNGVTVGVGIDVATDAIMKIRTRAQTGYATIDALGYKVSGVAGLATFSGAIASITIVNGLVTAAS